jgi:RimJ/RimL family protein N-acetyltransferase
MLFETDHLLARPYTLDDVEDAFDMYRRPEVMRYLMGGTPVTDLEAQRTWLASRIAKFEAMPRGLGAWAVVETKSGRVVGTAIHKPITDDPASEIEIGWHLNPRVWGRGYATEIGRALLTHGHDRMRLPRLIAVIEPPNRASIAVALRIGMTALGTTTQYHDGMNLCLFESLRG